MEPLKVCLVSVLYYMCSKWTLFSIHVLWSSVVSFSSNLLGYGREDLEQPLPIYHQAVCMNHHVTDIFIFIHIMVAIIGSGPMIPIRCMCVYVQCVPICSSVILRSLFLCELG